MMQQEPRSVCDIAADRGGFVGSGGAALAARGMLDATCFGLAARVWGMRSALAARHHTHLRYLHGHSLRELGECPPQHSPLTEHGESGRHSAPQLSSVVPNVQDLQQHAPPRLISSAPSAVMTTWTSCKCNGF